MKSNLARKVLVWGLGLSAVIAAGCKSDGKGGHGMSKCTTKPTTTPTTYPAVGYAPINSTWRPGTPLERTGDEIMVCGQLFHTGTRVVLWTDPGGYDAYRTERRFAPWDVADFQDTQKAMPKLYDGPNRYGIRKSQIDEATFERVRGGGWDLPTLQNCVDQFVYHFDVTGTSRQCFNILQDHRSLSVHFMCDVDGTIYQTLDLKERAWHATTSNGRSIGIEIANIGAYGVHDKDNTLEQWYRKDPSGQTRMVLPPYLSHNSGILTPNFIARPIRNEPVVGEIQGSMRRMYDLTPQQYDSLIKLTATLCTVFPKLNCDAPRNADGSVINHKLPDEQLNKYQGLLGHYHVQTDKDDPGPAFQWDRIVYGSQALMTEQAKAANKANLGHPAVAINGSATVAPSTAARMATHPTSNPTTRP
jgi:N-acetyl-anhydromuramyl-L-alanine amidase AmpD